MSKEAQQNYRIHLVISEYISIYYSEMFSSYLALPLFMYLHAAGIW